MCLLQSKIDQCCSSAIFYPDYTTFIKNIFKNIMSVLDDGVLNTTAY